MSANPNGAKCQNCGKENKKNSSFCSRCGTTFGDGKDPLMGLQVGIHVIEKKIGAGGSGAVYQGSHAKLGKRVAIKVLRADLVTDEETKQRFDREAKVLAQMEHPHIVSIADFGYVDGVGPYMVMEWLEGLTLFEGRKQRGYLSFPEIVIILDQLTDALSFMHQRGIVHRDLKPENMMLVRPPNHNPKEAGDLSTHRLKLYDFGIALFTQGEEKRLTAMGMVVGTPHYMAPEQIIVDAPVDHRADLYALGAIVYELLTGRPPFWGVKKPVHVMESHLRKAPPLLREVLSQREFPQALEEVVAKSLAKSPGDRYQDARALFEALRNAVMPQYAQPAMVPMASPVAPMAAPAAPIAGPVVSLDNAFAIPDDLDRTVVGGAVPDVEWANTQQFEPPSPEHFYSNQPGGFGVPQPAQPPPQMPYPPPGQPPLPAGPPGYPPNPPVGQGFAPQGAPMPTGGPPTYADDRPAPDLSGFENLVEATSPNQAKSPGGKSGNTFGIVVGVLAILLSAVSIAIVYILMNQVTK